MKLSEPSPVTAEVSLSYRQWSQELEALNPAESHAFHPDATTIGWRKSVVRFQEAVTASFAFEGDRNGWNVAGRVLATEVAKSGSPEFLDRFIDHVAALRSPDIPRADLAWSLVEAFQTVGMDTKEELVLQLAYSGKVFSLIGSPLTRDKAQRLTAQLLVDRNRGDHVFTAFHKQFREFADLVAPQVRGADRNVMSGLQDLRYEFNQPSMYRPGRILTVVQWGEIFQAARKSVDHYPVGVADELVESAHAFALGLDCSVRSIAKFNTLA